MDEEEQIEIQQIKEIPQEEERESLMSANQRLLKSGGFEVEVISSGKNLNNSQSSSNRFVMLQKQPQKIIYEFEDKE